MRLFGLGKDMQCPHLIKYDGKKVEVSGLSFQGFELGKLAIDQKLLQAVSQAMMFLDASQYHFCQSVKNAPDEESKRKFYDLMMQDKVRAQDIWMGLATLTINPESKQVVEVLTKMLLQNHTRALQIEEQEKIDIPKEQVEPDSPNNVEIGTSSLKDKINDLEKSYLDSPNANEFQKLRAQTTSRFNYTGFLRLIDEKFDLEGLKTLCLEYRDRYPKLDYDNISGSNKQGKARELILYLEKRNKLADFYDFVMEYITSRDEV